MHSRLVREAAPSSIPHEPLRCSGTAQQPLRGLTSSPTGPSTVSPPSDSALAFPQSASYPPNLNLNRTGFHPAAVPVLIRRLQEAQRARD